MGRLADGVQKKGPRTPKFDVQEKKRKSLSEEGSPDARAPTNEQEPSEARDHTNEKEVTADTELLDTPSLQPDPPAEAVNPTTPLSIPDAKPSELPTLFLTPRKRHSDSFREIADSQASEASDDSFHDSQEYPDFYDVQLGSAALTTPEARSVGWRSSPVLGGSPELKLASERVERDGSPVAKEEVRSLVGVSSAGEPDFASSPPLVQRPPEHSAAEGLHIPDASSRPPQELPSLHPAEEIQNTDTAPQPSQRLPSLRPRRPATRSQRLRQLAARDQAEASITPDTASQSPQQLPGHNQAETSLTPDTASQPSQHLQTPHMEAECPSPSTEPPVAELTPRSNKRSNDVTTTPPKKRTRRSLFKSVAIPPWKRADPAEGFSSAAGAERPRRASKTGLSRAMPARSEEEEMAQVVAEASRTSSLGRTTRSGLVHGKVSAEEIEAAFPDPDPDPEFGRFDGNATEVETPAPASSTGEAREADVTPRTGDNVDERRVDTPMLPPPRPAVPEEQDDEGVVSDESSYTNVMSTPLRDYGRDFTARSRPSLISAPRRASASKRTPAPKRTPTTKPAGTRTGVKKSGSKTRSSVPRSAATRMAELPTSSAADSMTDTSTSKTSTAATAATTPDDEWVPKQVMAPPEPRPMIPLPAMGRARRKSRLSSAPSTPAATPLSSRPGARSVRGGWTDSA